ncbi:MAG: type I methionyl aminopeptidase [Candidatus Improbicoccus pseudotrichonymphae]|uniref:Methionine aminopeptidase n=1 Tax=Candidatus Improbicoccus pseudotrichonymphae TaxID=3033792 RepID=A0AA48I3V5_9FIRM|nr:MAG: type I methionyl aminopeptidase [Candidatus Improbicoccus pseudotrichonymphae]
MIDLKNSEEIKIMRQAGRISALALRAVGEAIRPGISTMELDIIAKEFIKKSNGVPSFLNFLDYPATTCISINEEIVHGIPDKNKILKEGDIVSVDVGACYKGYHGDNARTFPCGVISEEASRLLKITEDSLYFAIDFISKNKDITTGDLGFAVQNFIESNDGYGVVKNYTGHGIGRSIHETPRIPNYGNPGEGVNIVSGMTIAVEPMVTIGSPDYKVLDDKWTVVTLSGNLSAHFEHTIAVTDSGVEILTLE